MTIKQLDRELESIDSISGKLDHLTKYHFKIKGTIRSDLSGEKYRSKLSIYRLVEKFTESHFKHPNTNVEITFWFLKFNAKNYLEKVLLTAGLKRRLEGKRKEFYIKQELDKLDVEKVLAEEAYKKLDIDSRYKDPAGYVYLLNSDKEKQPDYQSIEILRVLDGYYEKNPTEHAITVAQSPEVIAYAKHNLYRKLLNEMHTPNTTNEYAEGKRTFNNLRDIFLNPEKSEKYINILKEVEPPIIDDKNQYLLGPRQKGAFTSWIKALKSKGLIIKVSDDKLSELLNKEFTFLHLGKDGKTLRNDDTTAFRKYHPKILHLLS